jgi:hypothetical protein
VESEGGTVKDFLAMFTSVRHGGTLEAKNWAGMNKVLMITKPGDYGK